MNVKKEKVYVLVKAVFGKDGKIIPRSFIWTDGVEYTINKVTNYIPGSVMRADDADDRYTVWVEGKRSYLYFERNHSLSGDNIGRWYIETEIY